MLLLRLNDGVLQVIVEDSGTGIPNSFLPQLFQPYKQVQATGAERGTGLGLSITKGLLQRMQGRIDVESKYQLDPGVGAANSGTQFTLTIPIVNLDNSSDPLPQELNPVRIQIVHSGKNRDIEGLIAAWTSFGVEVSRIQANTDISNDSDEIIWADLSVLRDNHVFCVKLLRQRQHLVLVPYKDKALLDEIVGTSPPANIIPIRKPLIWHRMVQTIIETRKGPNTPDFNENNDITPSTDGLNHSVKTSKKPSMEAKKIVLLVEDNKVPDNIHGKYNSIADWLADQSGTWCKDADHAQLRRTCGL
jgi:hypothetical protein